MRLRKLEVEQRLEAVAKELEKEFWSVPVDFSKRSMRDGVAEARHEEDRGRPN